MQGNCKLCSVCLNWHDKLVSFPQGNTSKCNWPAMQRSTLWIWSENSERSALHQISSGKSLWRFCWSGLSWLGTDLKCACSAPIFFSRCTCALLSVTFTTIQMNMKFMCFRTFWGISCRRIPFIFSTPVHKVLNELEWTALPYFANSECVQIWAKHYLYHL